MNNEEGRLSEVIPGRPFFGGKAQRKSSRRGADLSRKDLTQRREDAKVFKGIRKFLVFLCAFAPLREDIGEKKRLCVRILGTTTLLIKVREGETRVYSFLTFSFVKTVRGNLGGLFLNFSA